MLCPVLFSALCLDLSGFHERNGGFKAALSVGDRLLGNPLLLIERQQLEIDRGDVGDQFRLYSLMSCYRLQIGGFRSSDTASETAPDIGLPGEVTRQLKLIDTAPTCTIF